MPLTLQKKNTFYFTIYSCVTFLTMQKFMKAVLKKIHAVGVDTGVSLTTCSLPQNAAIFVFTVT